ncbi:hypothetical protein [Aquihabitans sp. McL0605]|uniref:hypothetical protein n=1 Tax=Aquihabitans sp. McL0605 TaxID=3415671 RepID=UPI003CFB6DA3
MTTTTSTLVDHHATARRPWAALAGVALAALIVVVGNTNVDKGAGDNGGTGPMIVTGIVCLVAAAVIYFWALSRVQRPNRAALWYGIAAVVSLPVFWSGITPILAATSVGLLAESPARSRGAAIAAAGACVATVLAIIGAVSP